MITYGMTKDEVENAGRSGATHENKAKILNEFYLYTDKEEQSVGQWLANHGYWESWITSWMTNNINPGSVCIDIGANYGYYTLLMQKLVGPNGGVYAFEANPELCQLIALSASELPDDYGQLALYGVALSNHKGTVTLDIPSKFIGGSTIMHDSALPSSISDYEWDRKITVPSDTLDNIIEPQKIDLIKMDIEGAEYLAWQGMNNILEHTDLIIIEIGNYTPQELIDIIYQDWKVSMVSQDGSEIPLNKEVIPYLPDLVMAVLRRKDV